ncbi:MAG: UDP-N-acetylglucosamine 1-carboxyvinyltransferase, partial [Bacillota bacterium]
MVGGGSLNGQISVEGAKNAVLPLMAASLLAAKGSVSILDVPMLNDVKILVQLIRTLGPKVVLQQKNLQIPAYERLHTQAPYELVCKMRASFLVLGPLLARMKHACVPIPGGCKIGSRPIDLHLKGLEALGAKFNLSQGNIEGRVDDYLRGAKIYLDSPSVGATQNI